MATTANEVIQSFESSFADKREIPTELENMWLKKAIGRFSLELTPLTYDDETQMFDSDLPQYVIDTLAEFMKLFYQERVVSMTNKITSIVTKDISWDGAGKTKTAVKDELDYIAQKTAYHVALQKPTAYSN